MVATGVTMSRTETAKHLFWIDELKSLDTTVTQPNATYPSLHSLTQIARRRDGRASRETLPDASSQFHTLSEKRWMKQMSRDHSSWVVGGKFLTPLAARYQHLQGSLASEEDDVTFDHLEASSSSGSE